MNSQNIKFMQHLKVITHTIVFLLISNILYGQTVFPDDNTPLFPHDADYLGDSYFFPVSALSSNICRDIFPVSPRAASLGVFGQIPVGNFTGTAQISIPLYEIRYKELSVPLQISYQASGNKPDAFPGPVGLGWAIQAGGSISRQINGESDMGSFQSSDSKLSRILDDPRGESEWPDMGTTFSFLQDAPIAYGGYDKNDVDPDEYNFNINGHTGTFYLNHKDSFQIQSAQGGSFLVVKHPRTDPVVTFPILEDHFPPHLPEVPSRLPEPSCNCANKVITPKCCEEWAKYNERLNERNLILNKISHFYGVNPYLPEFQYTNKLYLPDNIGGFTMIDSQGIKYIFGATDGSNKSDTSIEFSRPGLERDDPEMRIEKKVDYGYAKNVQPVSWHLTAIESPHGYRIEFIYEQECYIVKTRFTDLVLYRHSNNWDLKHSVNGMIDDGERSSFINGCYLKEIIFPSGKISFTNSLARYQTTYPTPNSYDKINKFIKFYSYPDIRFANTERILNSYYLNDAHDFEPVLNKYMPHQIDRVTVLDNNNNVVREIDFDYGNSILERLKLTKLSIKGANDNVQDYSFEYNNSLKLPGYLSGKTDHYGFYNGIELFPNPDKITSTLLGNFNYIHERKIPNSSFAQAEILQKIIYPTKGYSVFEYESHDYSKMCKTWPFETVNNSNGNQITGGVRIKSIKNYDSNNSLLTEKKYHYTTDYQNGGNTSSGVLAYIPQYSEVYINKRIHYNENDVTPASALAEFYRFSTTSLYNAMASRRNHITYSEVIVEEPGNGFTVYKYKNHDNGYGDKQPLYFCGNALIDMWTNKNEELWKADEGLSMELERGQIISEEVFDENKKPMKKLVYSYNTDENRFNENVRYVKLNSNSIRFTGYRSQRLTAGVHYTYFPYLEEKTEINYVDSGSVVQKENYMYDERYRLIKSSTRMDSRNQEYKTEISYTVDQDILIPIVKKMMENNMVAYPFEKTLKTPDYRKTKEIFQYRDDVSSNAIPLLHKTFSQYNDDIPMEETTIARYDQYGNPCEIYDRTGKTICILWSYHHQQPIAQIQNATYDQIQSILTQSVIDQIAAVDIPTKSDSLLINNLRYHPTLINAQITTYTYKPLIGMTSETTPGGFTVYYDYDPFGRLKEKYYYEKGTKQKRTVETYNYHYKE